MNCYTDGLHLWQISVDLHKLIHMGLCDESFMWLDQGRVLGCKSQQTHADCTAREDTDFRHGKYRGGVGFRKGLIQHCFHHSSIQDLGIAVIAIEVTRFPVHA